MEDLIMKSLQADLIGKCENQKAGIVKKAYPDPAFTVKVKLDLCLVFERIR